MPVVLKEKKHWKDLWLMGANREGLAETTERGCRHTGHTRHEQQSSEEQGGQGNGAKSKQAHHRGP